MAEYLELVQKIRDASKKTIWYRGVGKTSYDLEPSIYRGNPTTDSAGLIKLERDMMTRFQQRSIPFVERELDEPWATLFFMQHYRVPTRLLDWSESPLIGLFFALTRAHVTKSKTGRIVYEEPVAIWVLDPVAWNRFALRHLSFDGEVLVPDDDFLNPYNPSNLEVNDHLLPLALYGAHNSARIAAQQGAFTVFANGAFSMDSIYKRYDDFPDALLKIEISKSRIKRFREELYGYGIKESVVFPDLEGLANETRRLFGFDG